MAAITIHAPWVNLVMATITSTTPVTTAPTPLMTMLRRHPWPRSLRHRRTIPACDSVNAVNTPTT